MADQKISIGFGSSLRIRSIITDEATGGPRDLTGATVVTVALIKGVSIAGTTTVIDAMAGEVEIYWPPATLTVGRGLARVFVSYSASDAQEVWREAIEVRPFA